MNERKLIPGYPGYEADAMGRVYSVAHGNGRELRGKPNPQSGYVYVRMMTESTRKSVRLSCLIAKLFLGDAPSPAHQVRHLNGNKLNNAATNLKWGTAKENAEDRDRHGTTVKGELSHKAKLTREDVIAIRESAEGGESFASIGRRYGLVYQNISMIVSRKTWRHV